MRHYREGVDVLIVGTGVAALLLAQSLVEAGAADTIRLVGPRVPLQPHWLSYWSAAATPFDAHVVAEWSELRVIDAQGVPIPVRLERFRYRTFPAQQWADAVLSQLLKSGRIELVEAEVERVVTAQDQARVFTRNDQLVGDWAFVSGDVGLTPEHYQRFVGWEVEVSAPIAIESMTFLDFRLPQDHDFRFMYALPLGPHRLFVEHVSYQPCDHAAYLRHYLKDVFGLDDFRVVSSEGGRTPIFRRPPPRGQGRGIGIGVQSGLANTRTGYAVMRMWRDAQRIAAQLSGGKRLGVRRRAPSLYQVADLFFCDVLRKNPAQLATLLPQLFSRVSGDAALAFLDEQASLREQIAVARAMPEWARWLLFGARPATQ